MACTTEPPGCGRRKVGCRFLFSRCRLGRDWSSSLNRWPRVGGGVLSVSVRLMRSQTLTGGWPVACRVRRFGARGRGGGGRGCPAVLSDLAASVLAVENRGRLVRFGVEHLEVALAASGRPESGGDHQRSGSGHRRGVDLDVCRVVWAACREEAGCPRYRCGHG
jgi:hypothetical protein